MQQYIDDFLNHMVVQGKRASTSRNYALYLKRFVDFVGDITIEEITPQIVASFQDYISKHGNSPATQSYHSVALRSFLTYLHRMGYKVLSPTAIQLPKYARKQAEYLTDEEIEKLLEAVAKGSLRDRVIIEVFLCTGLRISELTHLTRNNINIVEREISLIGKGGKQRVVFLTPKVQNLLQLYLDTQETKSPFVFPSLKSGTIISDRQVQRIVDIYVKQAGITKSVHPHTLRHSLASRFLRRGANLREVQEMLGHSSIATTTIYTHITNRELKKTFDNVIEGKMVNVSDKLDEVLEMQKEILKRLNNQI